MKHLNVEIKAKCSEQEQNDIRQILKENGAYYQGLDHQIDTYFNVANGRLKIRSGNIENNLIYYERDENPAQKRSKILLCDFDKNSKLDEILSKVLEKKVVIDKQREIYFIENVKFHLDNVKDLGRFVEIEAISKEDSIKENKLIEQLEFYKKLFKINESDLINCSYSDMLLLQKLIK